MSDFLGPYGQATVILMKAHFESELPKLKDLKKILQIPDGRYYKSGGRNYSSLHSLERLACATSAKKAAHLFKI